MVRTSRQLAAELLRQEDDFITVKLKEKEYVIEDIRRVPTHTDVLTTHLCLNIRDGGEGNILR